jgi:serine/threonine protein kinase
MTLTPDSQAPTADTPGDWLPGFELEGIVGTGGFGTVFRARQLKLDRVVAVKVIRLDRVITPSLAARFEAEAVTLARLQHPNVVQVLDCGRHVERVFIVMELLDGEDLGRRIRRTGRLAEPVSWAIVRQAAAALAHAAAHGIIHRDVKPENLFLVPPPLGVGLPPGVPLVKVADFGLARAPASDLVDSQLSATGAVVGTPVYAAPEQARQSAGLDHRADVYALGATAFHILSGRPPFSGRTVWEVVEQKLASVPRLTGVSRESADLVAAMMAPDPKDRIGTYEELIARIDALPRAGRTVRRRWVWVAATGGAVAVIGGNLIGSSLPPRGPGVTLSVSTDQYESSGQLEALFDGASINGWRPPSAGGVWRPEKDDEALTVLSGMGFTRRQLGPVEDYRVSIGLDVHSATAAEVHFAIPVARPETGTRLVLRVSKSEGATLGLRDGPRGALRPLAQAVPFPPPAWFEERRPYLEVKFERAGGRWTAWFNGVEVGRPTDDGVPKAAELWLFADGGRARVDSVLLTTLQKK